MTMKQCPKCNGTRIDTGRITSAGAVAYRSDRQRHPFVAANVETYVCLDCGYSESYIEKKYRDKIEEMDPREK